MVLTFGYDGFMSRQPPDQEHGPLASGKEFARFDQVDKPDYHLAEAADDADAFDDSFQFTTCDLGRYLHGDAADRAAFACELGQAMAEVGFAILEGHGVDPQLFSESAGWVEEIFTTTSLEEKRRFLAQRHEAVREGYFPLKETSLIHPDLVEGWVFGRRAFQLDGDGTMDPLRFWPRRGFERRFRRLVNAETPLIRPIMAAILQSLGCDPRLYDDRLAPPHFALRLNYYPPLQGADGRSAAGRLLGHEDIDLFTLLPAPEVEGLQVLHRNGKWLRLHAPSGSIVLNTGDYLQRLSNDRLPSTTHRVGRPRDPALAAKARVSFPLAAYLPPGDILRVLPGIPDPRYEPIPVITFHTRTTAKFYGDDHAVEQPPDDPRDA